MKSLKELRENQDFVNKEKEIERLSQLLENSIKEINNEFGGEVFFWLNAAHTLSFSSNENNKCNCNDLTTCQLCSIHDDDWD